jgi:hypothetical protein
MGTESCAGTRPRWGLNARGHRVRPGFSWQWWRKREDHTSGVVNVGTARYRLRTRDVVTRFLNGLIRTGERRRRQVRRFVAGQRERTARVRQGRRLRLFPPFNASCCTCQPCEVDGIFCAFVAWVSRWKGNA